MYKVSVIVPIYGVEKYIERCACSLFEQTLCDMEFIFIDDCTPDASMGILNRVIERYRPRFAGMNWVVRTERMSTNSGLPTVRRHGIQLCNGKYIAHCDSDDWVDANMYRDMYTMAEQQGADMVVCDYKITDGENVLFEKKCWGEMDSSNFPNELVRKKYPWSIWNKLVRRSVYFDKIIYPTQPMGEDMAITMQLISRCNIIAYIPMTYYSYFTNSQSISRAISEDKCVKNYIDNMQNVDIVMQSCKENAIGLDEEVKLYLKWVAMRNIWPLQRQKKYRSMWSDAMPKLTLFIMSSRLVTLHQKLDYFLTKITKGRIIHI